MKYISPNEHPEPKFDTCDICNEPILHNSEDYQVGAANHYDPCWLNWVEKGMGKQSYRNGRIKL